MLLSLDTETTGLSLRHDCSPFTVSTCTEAGKVRLWQWPVDPFTRKVDVNGIDRQEIIDYLSGHELIFHNATFDLRALANIGILLSSRELQWEVPVIESVWSHAVEVSRIHDTLFMSHLTDSRGVYTADGRTVHGLKELALCRLGISDGDEEVLRKATVKARLEGKKLGWSLGMDRQGDSQVSWDYWMPKALYDHDPKSWKPFKTVCSEYAANDAVRTMQLYLACQEIIQEDGRWQMYLDELQFIPILYMIEEIGMHIHEESLRKELQGHHKAISRLTDELYRLAGSFSGITNINSHPQLRRLLFEVWNLGATTLTKTGQASTAVDVLTNLRDYLTAKEEASGKGSASTPLKFLRALVGYRDGSRPVPGLRTHEKAAQYLTFYSNELTADSRFAPSINPVGTKTTRWSTKGSQNIGAKQLVDDETGEQIVLPLRGVFGPDKDHLWVSIDYAQLELRIFAALSGEQSLINSFEEGHDFHGYVAERIFKKPPDKITKEERTIAKNTNFACVSIHTPILKSNLKWVAAYTLRPGDKLLAFDENQKPGIMGRAGARRWCEAVVTDNAVDVRNCVQVNLANGEKLICTEDHLWLIKNQNEKGKKSVWMRADELIHSDHIIQPLEVWDSKKTWEAGWLAGFYDGEGHVSRTGRIGVNQNAGHTFDFAKKLMLKTGLKIVIYDDCGTSSTKAIMINGRVSDRIRFLGEIRPQRLIPTIVSKICGTMFQARNIVKVLSVEKIGPRRVAVLNTSTRTYIAKGYASHNCIYGGSPAKVDATAGMKGAYDSFIHQFPNAKQFMEETISFARKNGHVLTADGYPLWVPPREPYKGTDYRIQGTAGRIIKLAMRWLVYGRHEWKQVEGEKQYTYHADSIPSVVDWHNVKMICQIHDELLFEISKRLTKAQIVTIVRRCCTVMEQAGQSMGIETPTDAKIFLDNWSKGISIREYIGTKGNHAITH